MEQQHQKILLYEHDFLIGKNAKPIRHDHVIIQKKKVKVGESRS